MTAAVRCSTEISGKLPSLRQNMSWSRRLSSCFIAGSALRSVVSTYLTRASVCTTARPVSSA